MQELDIKNLINLLCSTILICHLGSCSEENNTCANGNNSEEFIEWSINDETFILDFDHIDVYFADDRVLNIYPLTPEVIDGPFENFWIKYDLIEAAAHFRAAIFNTDTTFIHIEGSELEMDVSSFSSVGDLICIQFDNGEFSGELRVILDKIVKSGIINGKAWLDDNENGIQDPDESPLVGAFLSLKTDSENLQAIVHDVYPQYIPREVIRTDDKGHFSFNSVFVNYPMRLLYRTWEELEATIANAGNDEAIDSDFHLVGKSQNSKTYSTEPFIIQDGGIKKDIGLGIIKQ